MPALMILTRESTHDQHEVDSYQSEVAQTFEGHKVKRLAAGVPLTLEGTAKERTVVLEFPTLEAAHRWYGSPAYQAVREHRLRGAAYSVMMIETA